MSDVIVARADEVRVLDQLHSSHNSELLAIYGRRRVGKTFLIRHYFSRKKNIFFDVMGTKNAPLCEQIDKFIDRISEVFYDGIALAREKNWNQTFKLLTKSIKNNKTKHNIVLFFDELPWLATKNSRLLQNIDYYWNQYWSKDKRIKLIVCGSSASWIIKKIIKNKAGLHNRVTYSICLEPYTLKQTKLFLRHQGFRLTNKQICEIYMILGGIPFYLSKLQKNLSITKNIEQLAFQKKAFLQDEFDNLFDSLFDDGEVYANIIKCIAEYQSGISQKEIFDKVKEISKGGSSANKLKVLEETGFIVSFIPHHHSKKGVYYKVIDEYVLFYLRWIEPLKQSLILRGFKAHYWEMTKDSPSWATWAGHAFELLCYKHITQISDALALSPTAIPSAWRFIPSKGTREHGAQIDLLFDRTDDAITICEIKYTTKAFYVDKSYAAILSKKLDVYRKKTGTNKQLFLVLITASGLKTSMYSEEMISGVVDLEDLFK